MLKISSRRLGDLECIVLEGEIDMYVSPKVRNALLDAFDESEKGVAVDLNGVPYMDSSGIATLIEGVQWCKKNEKRFLLVGVQDSVLSTLKLAKLHSFFDIYSTDEEALASLS